MHLCGHFQALKGNGVPGRERHSHQNPIHPKTSWNHIHVLESAPVDTAKVNVVVISIDGTEPVKLLWPSLENQPNFSRRSPIKH